MFRTTRIPLLRLLCLSWLVLPINHARCEDYEFFEQRIRPLLAEKCYACHAQQRAEGGLRLDTKAGLLRGGQHGPVFPGGDSHQNLLLEKLRPIGSGHEAGAVHQLTDSQLADLAKWLHSGAPDPREVPAQSATAKTNPAEYDFPMARRQWAFHAPADPPIPRVTNHAWIKSPIDAFILAKLEEKNLAPEAAADKGTLLRRATFDLIGLPPTPAEMADFLRDDSSDAFAKVIDRLLASPRYGERWGRHWLDVVRYADSLDSRGIGGEGDIAEAWRYRDWVVQSFNRDLPYDQFVRLQIAGDLIQPSEPARVDADAIIATGVYAIGNWGNGDADKEKLITDIADDQVDVTGRAFLGLTLACARCHDHKFDPIPTADYYSMAGIFFSSHILPRLTPKGQGEVLMRIPLASPADLAARQQRELRMAELEKKIATDTDAALAAFIKTLLPQTANYLEAIANERNHVAGARGVARLRGVIRQWRDYLGFGEYRLLQNLTRDLAGKPGLYVLRNARGDDTPCCTVNASENEVSFSTIKMPPRTVAIHPSPNAGIAVGWRSPITGTIGISGGVTDADPNCGDGIEWAIDLRGVAGPSRLAAGAIPNGGAQVFHDGAKSGQLSSISVHAGDVIQLVVSPKAEYSCDTTLIELKIAEVDGEEHNWDLKQDFNAAIGGAKNPFPDAQGHESVWLVYDLGGQAPVGQVADGSPLADWLKQLANQAPGSDLGQTALAVQNALLATDVTHGTSARLYGDLTNPRGPFWSAAEDVAAYFPEDTRHSLQSLRAELSELKLHPPGPLAMALGFQDGGVPESPQAGVHDVRIHQRGRYDRLGDAVPRRFPRLLAGDEQPPVGEGSGRLALARWVAGTENPLTARVMVNRIWQHHFGEGIVRTPNNFGKLGTPPTHPELLDFLAHRFIDAGWSVKAMHRMIMLSAAYQQSTVPDSATLKGDPENLWLGRMNRHRLESEELRDSLLAVAGKLDAAMGGPAIADLNLGRRTLYVRTVRSDRATYQFLFDAADPGTIAEKRIDSTVAPQALFLLNHPFVLEQARALAERVAKESSADTPGRIEWLYRQLYGRTPSPRELQIGEKAVGSDATPASSSTEAWEQYCQVLLCANEFVYLD